MVSGIAADTRIYAQLAQAPQQQFNPLQQVAQFQNILQGQQSMQIQREQFGMQKEKFELEKQALAAEAQKLEREQQKEQAIAEIAQGSVNPDTGQLDWLRFMNQILENPMTAMDGPELAIQAVQARQLEATTATEMFELAMQKRAKEAEAAGALIQQFPQKGKSIPTDALAGTIADMFQEGIVDREQAANLIQGLSAVPEGPERDQLVERIALQSEEGREALASGLERMKAVLDMEKLAGDIQEQQQKIAGVERERMVDMQAQAMRAGRTVRDAREALKQLDDVWDQSELRAARSLIGETPEFNLTKFAASTFGNLGFVNLLDIKRSGAGLGNVTDNQLQALQGLEGVWDIRLPVQEQKKIFADIILNWGGIMERMTDDDFKLLGLEKRELERFRKMRPQLLKIVGQEEDETGLEGLSEEELFELLDQMRGGL